MSGVGQEGPTGVLTSADSAGHPGHVTLSAPTMRLETATVESTAGEIGSAGTITIQGFGGNGGENRVPGECHGPDDDQRRQRGQHAGHHHVHRGHRDLGQWNTSSRPTPRVRLLPGTSP